MTQRYETQLSYMQSIIEAKKNLLNMEKDIYDYEKNINNQTKSIASLEKQLTALQGDDSESGRLRRSQLQQSLDEANQELQDTEYERYISDQQNMLDNLYSQYEDLIHELEKNFEKVVNDGVELINGKSGEISKAIKDYATIYGYNPSGDMTKIVNALTSSGDGDVKTLPGTINNGFSNLGTIFQKGVTDIVNAYNGTKTFEETFQPIPETQDNSDNSGADKNHKDRQNSQVITADGANISLQNMQNAVNINSERDKLKKLVVGKNYSTKATKSYDKYSSKLNQMLAKHTGYVIKSGANDIQAFALSLGLKTATNGKNGSKFAQDGNVYQELKKRFSSLGFSSGGIGKLIKASGEDGLALVRNGEGFIAPEHVDSIKDLVNIVPDMTQFTKSLTNIKPVNRNIGNTFGDIVINAELPNVKDSYDFIDDIKNNRKTQQALTIATKDVIEKGKITNNIQSIM